MRTVSSKPMWEKKEAGHNNSEGVRPGKTEQKKTQKSHN